jgi:hypothetical protein
MTLQGQGDEQEGIGKACGQADAPLPADDDELLPPVEPPLLVPPPLLPPLLPPLVPPPLPPPPPPLRRSRVRLRLSPLRVREVKNGMNMKVDVKNAGYE